PTISFYLLLPFFIFFSVNTINAGSIYSSQGIGLVRYFNSGRSVGMGGVGLAIIDNLTVSFLNPASLSAIPLTTFSGSFVHESSQLKSSSQNGTIVDTNIFGVQFIVPLYQNVAALSIGINPYSSIEYNFVNATEVEPILSESVVGDGGVSTAFLSFAVRPFKNLYLGATGLFYFGVLKNTYRVDFESPEFFDVNDEVSRSFTAGGLRVGFVYKIVPGWSIGGVFSTATKFDANTTVTLQRVTQFTDFPDKNIEIPIAYGGGTAFNIGRKVLVGIDYYAQKWTDSSIENFVNDSKRIGIGFEYSSRGNYLDPFFSRVAYRAGFFYRDLGLEMPEGEKVTEFFGSIGIGIPIKWSAARLDLALEFGRRGNVSRNPVRENIIRLTGSVAVGNRWFYRGGRK
ncbi:MAG: hypothetical protein ACE5IR_21830, partial [bacterium]